MLKRYLEMVSATPDQFDGLAFQDLIRTGNEAGLLLGNWPCWKQYRDMRSKTSQTYDEAKALEVVAGNPGFIEEVLYLHERLGKASKWMT